TPHYMALSRVSVWVLIPAVDQIDLVDVEQLVVDAGHRRRIGLVVVIDELDRTAEEPALGVDVFLPNLLGEQRRLAVGRKPAGLRYAIADLDRLAGLRPGRACEQQHARRERSREVSHRPMGYIMQHRHPPIAIVSGSILWAAAEVKLVGRRPFIRR